MSQHRQSNLELNANQNMKPRKVLVVDDDPIIRDMMVEILESEGYHVATARNGHEALELLHGSEHYLVFLDMMMPGMDGKQMCEQLDADPPTRRRHAIILMSALGQLDAATTARVEDLIPKPFVVEDVLEMMERYMG